jgi:two-component system, OmpR family, KDP operon response regulator KdpE
MDEESRKVLIVDDERAIRQFVEVSLKGHGYTVYQAPDGRAALQEVRDVRPHLLIVDLGLPDMDGVDLIRAIREWNPVPIIVLSVRDRDDDKIAALDAGADDYLTKPFSPGELIARIRAIFRRTGVIEGQSILRAGDLQLDLIHHQVFLAEKEVSVTATEFNLLETLTRSAGKVLTHRRLIRDVWAINATEHSLHVLRVTVSNLRRKLEEDPHNARRILSEPGIGYRLTSGSSGDA